MKNLTLEELKPFQDRLVPCVCGGYPSLAMSICSKPQTYSVHCMGDAGPNCWKSPHTQSPEEMVQHWNGMMEAARAAGLAFTHPPREKFSGNTLY